MNTQTQKRATKRESALGAGSVAAVVWILIGASALAQVSGDKTTEGKKKSAPRPTREVPQSNQTGLGLYATPQEAYEMWKARPKHVHVLDVRSFEEYIFVGHADMARNIPLVFPKFELPTGKPTDSAPPAGKVPPGCSGVPNTNFVSSVRAWYAPDTTILVMCSTGGRAAMAVNQLAQAGYTHVYNIVNGLEGDRVDDPGSVYHGKRMRNGWKNCGLPWTYSFDPDLMWVDPSQ